MHTGHQKNPKVEFKISDFLGKLEDVNKMQLCH